MHYLFFDIETVPRSNLDDALEAEATKRAARELERGILDEAEANSLVRSVSPFLGQVIAIGMRLYNAETGEKKDKVICETDEKSTLETFLETINHGASQNLRYVHYNGLGFDIPYIIIRAAHFGLPITNRRFLDLRRFRYDPQIDLMMFLSHWSFRDAVSLDVACHSFDIPSPKEGEVKGNTVAAAFAEGNLEAVADYVMRDVEATFQLFHKVKDYL